MWVMHVMLSCMWIMHVMYICMTHHVVSCHKCLHQCACGISVLNTDLDVSPKRPETSDLDVSRRRLWRRRCRVAVAANYGVFTFGMSSEYASDWNASEYAVGWTLRCAPRCASEYKVLYAPEWCNISDHIWSCGLCSPDVHAGHVMLPQLWVWSLWCSCIIMWCCVALVYVHVCGGTMMCVRMML